MDKKIIIATVVGLTVLGVIVAILNLSSPNNQTSPSLTNTSNGGEFVAIDACDILTKKIVSDVFGGSISGTTPTKSTSTNNDLLVSTCNLTSQSGKGKNRVTNGAATLLARIARTEQGASNNRQGFQSNRPSEAVSVDEIGDKSYYIPTFNQLYVLTGDNWYILTSYKSNVLDGTLDDAKTFAKQLKFQ